MTMNVLWKCKKVTFEPRSRGRYAVRVDGVLQKDLVKRAQVSATRMRFAHQSKPPTIEPAPISTNKLRFVVGRFSSLYQSTHARCPYCDFLNYKETRFAGATECTKCGKLFKIQ
jgi:DNA-directed RNA polymerase subunit RPC12/RpoP